jgi:hypothetical protein
MFEDIINPIHEPFCQSPEHKNWGGQRTPELLTPSSRLRVRMSLRMHSSMEKRIIGVKQ